MVKESNKRIEKFAAKISGDIRKQRYDSQKIKMVEQETLASAELEKIELDVKGIVDGEPALYLPYYIIFAKEVYSKMKKFEGPTLTMELIVLMNKWASRGLNFIFMREIARRYSIPALDLYSVCPIPGLVGHWTFFTGSGATTRDLSGNNNHGTLNLPTWTNGIIGRGLDFDGVDDYVQIPHNAAFLGANLSNGFTISAWINPRSIGETAGNILSKSTDTTGQNGFFYAVTTSNRIAFRLNSGTQANSAVNSVNQGSGNWYHILITVSSGQLANFYVNGVLSGTANQDLVQTISTITTTNAMRIGNRATATDRTFDGLIDEVMFFNRFLSLNEIKRIYNTTKPYHI
jgi:hypothetical protein